MLHVCSIYLTVDLGDNEGTASEKRLHRFDSWHHCMINVLMEALEALTIRMGAMVKFGLCG